jgi:hypothetical protein
MKMQHTASWTALFPFRKQTKRNLQSISIKGRTHSLYVLPVAAVTIFVVVVITFVII